MTALNRRGFLGVLGATAATATLAGCAGSGGGSNSGGSGGSGGDANSLSFWSNHPGSSKDVEQQLIDAFHKENPSITVNLVDGGKNYEEVQQKFNTALSGNDLPDLLVVSDVTWFNFALNKQITPLDDLFAKAGVHTGDYVDSLFSDYELEGKHYALPYARSTPLFYYNKEVWQKAGLPDRGPHDWHELLDWAPRIQQALGAGKHAVGMYDGADYLDWTTQNIIWNEGGAYSKEWDCTFTDPATVAGVELLKKFQDDKFLVVSKDPVTEYAAGLCGCCVMSTGSLSQAKKTAKFEIGTAFMPGAEQKKSCPTGGAGLAIPAKISDDRKVNALKLIDSLTSTQGTAIFAKATGYMPVRTSAKEAKEVKEYLQQTPQASTAIEQLEYTRRQDNARVLVPNGGKRIGGALDKVLAGSSVQEQMESLQKETQDIVDNQLKPKLPK